MTKEEPSPETTAGAKAGGPGDDPTATDHPTGEDQARENAENESPS